MPAPLPAPALRRTLLIFFPLHTHTEQHIVAHLTFLSTQPHRIVLQHLLSPSPSSPSRHRISPPRATSALDASRPPIDVITHHLRDCSTTASQKHISVSPFREDRPAAVRGKKSLVRGETSSPDRWGPVVDGLRRAHELARKTPPVHQQWRAGPPPRPAFTAGRLDERR